MKTALILGGAGFIGVALAKRLKTQGYWVRSIDIRHCPFEQVGLIVDDIKLFDLRSPMPGWLSHAPGGQQFDEVYQLACDMGGAGYIFTGDRDAKVMTSNVLINANVASTFARVGCGRLLYTSSSCVYNDAEADARARLFAGISGAGRLSEACAGQSPPSNGYGWEKLFSEQLYDAYRRNHGLNVCVTRFSTIYGPGSAFDDGREKAVAAICRKVIDAPHGGEVEVWGDGQQVRPLVYIWDLVDAITKLIRSDHHAPINIAGSEQTTCDDIARAAIALSNKRLTIKHVPGPIGKQVLDMTTDVAERVLGWTATTPFETGLAQTFEWIAVQKAKGHGKATAHHSR